MSSGVIAPALQRALEEYDPNARYRSNGGPRIISTSGEHFFGKVGGGRDIEQYEAEVACLRSMDRAAPGICPRLVSYGVELDWPYMLTEYKDLAALNTASATKLARRLALELHLPQDEESHGKYGFAVPTYCGVTRQANGWYDTWQECFSTMIGGMLDGLKGKHGGQFVDLISLGRDLQKNVIPYLLSPTRLKGAEPVLLHGDLWSGNVGTDSTGQPIIFDASCIYGHNEADLVLARMFGGFPTAFLIEYHKLRPKSEPVEEYDERVVLYELYHYLNHTVLFGSSYADQSRKHMRRLITYVEQSGHSNRRTF